MKRDLLDQLKGAAAAYSRAKPAPGPDALRKVASAVAALEKETGVRVAAPELADFASGESVLDAAVRLFGLAAAAAAAEDWHAARVAANEATARAEQAERELEAVSLEWRGLVHEAIRRRQPVPEIPAELEQRATRAQAIANLWGVGGAAGAFSTTVRGTRSREETMMQALAEDDWLPVTVYATALEGHLSKAERGSRAAAAIDPARRLIDRGCRQSPAAKLAAWTIREHRTGGVARLFSETHVV